MSEKNKQRNKYLFKNTAIIAIGNFASKFTSFFLVPLYTNYLTASQYGVADLLYTICNFLVPLFTLNIVEGVLRFSLDKNANEKKIIRIACTMLIPAAILGLLAVPIVKMFDGYGEWAWQFYFYMITYASSQIFLVALKGQEKLKKYSLGNFLHALLIAVFNIIFLVGLHMGPSGYFLAYIIANLVVTFYGMINCKVFSYIRNATFDKKLFKEMAKYSVVLMPTSFMWWVMNFLDRAMISGMISIADSGIYAVSYKLPTILSSVSAIFLQAWLFSAVKNDGEKGNVEYTNKVFNALAIVLIGVSMVLLILLKQIFEVYVSPEFYEAWKYVPVLMIGHIFMTLATFMSTSYNVKKDNKGFLYSATVGALMNVVLNAVLIPLIGVQGAAIATALSYLTVFMYRLFDTRKYIKIWIGPRMIFSMILVAIVAAMTFSDSFVISLAVQLLALFTFVAINYVFLKKILVRVGKRKETK
ncbi:polysaccharide biosynthesis C-terminal domain-containing protein [Candidatus Saccharibacteria bacterium]|nr:polysaccharide biosynthesis C-terminal domain-containing protein [Candidatus Saccharibacteria bacterium]